MAITITPYDNFKATVTGGTSSGGTPIDYLTDTIKGALVGSGYTPNIATHDFWDDVSAQELASGNGYTTGGIALASKTVTVTGGNADYDAADLSWIFTATKLFTYCVIYKDTGTPSTSPLMFLVDFGVNRSEDSQFDLRWNAAGIFRFD